MALGSLLPVISPIVGGTGTVNFLLREEPPAGSEGSCEGLGVSQSLVWE